MSCSSYRNIGTPHLPQRYVNTYAYAYQSFKYCVRIWPGCKFLTMRKLDKVRWWSGLLELELTSIVRVASPRIDFDTHTRSCKWMDHGVLLCSTNLPSGASGIWMILSGNLSFGAAHNWGTSQIAKHVSVPELTSKPMYNMYMHIDKSYEMYVWMCVCECVWCVLSSKKICRC